MRTFSSIEYKGGHPYLTNPRKVDVIIDPYNHEMTIKESKFLAPLSVKIKRDDILGISFDDATRVTARSYAAIRAAHLQDYKGFFDREEKKKIQLKYLNLCLGGVRRWCRRPYTRRSARSARWVWGYPSSAAGICTSHATL